MDFVAIDVETANADRASICQVGIVTFEGGTVKEAWQALVNPEDFFDGFNVSIHGITEESVEDSPTFAGVYDEVAARLHGRIIASHTSFDRVAVSRVCEKYARPPIEGTWLDTARVARRAWPQFAKTGYGLQNVAQTLGIEFEHHNAQEDARAAGEVLVRAIRETGLSQHDWLERVKQPIQPRGPSSYSSSRIAMEGNPEGPLYGEVIVFTGTLSIPRKEAAALASAAGCDVVETIAKRTTLLILGDQDVRKLAGHEKSSKHRKAEKLISKGQEIRILCESDFQRLVGLTT